MRAPEFTLTAGPTMASPRVLAALGSQCALHNERLHLRTEFGRNDPYGRARVRELRGLPRCDPPSTDDENTETARLDQQGNSAHRKRPAPLDSVTRNATYSATTATKLTLE